MIERHLNDSARLFGFYSYRDIEMELYIIMLVLFVFHFVNDEIFFE